MSDSLPPSVVKATKGEYEIPIKSLWVETWRQLLQMPKAFWQAFGLMFLVLLGTTIFMDFLLRWYDIGLIHFQNYQAQLPNLHTLHVLNSLKGLLNTFTAAIIQILRTLLIVSLAFLVLNQIRNQPIKVTMVFAFLKNWRSLLLISALLYLVNSILRYGLVFVFRAMHLYPLLPSQDFPMIALAYGAHTFLAVFLYTYFMAVAFMAGLLILDKKMTFKKSLYIAFKSINRHPLKNMLLLFLASWAYMGAGSDTFNLFFSIRSGYSLFAYLILLPGMFMAILFMLYKKMALQTKRSRMKNITLIILKVILGLVVLELFFSNIGLIWLLPVIALLITIQYQHIFSDKGLSYV
ncbi:hypothetical protein [Rickettsiella endosymbiont of Miltochrista miniata]|uniref:hypothetical protein n=1 Tax=Rickettsiella endosymbiont of Miltochrista miniata TaxID=3066239 RepID=UPI00313D3811